MPCKSRALLLFPKKFRLLENIKICARFYCEAEGDGEEEQQLNQWLNDNIASWKFLAGEHVFLLFFFFYCRAFQPVSKTVCFVKLGLQKFRKHSLHK